MIVLAIVGILAGLSVPAYRDHVLRANRVEARAALLGLATAEEKFYLQCNTTRACSMPSQPPPAVLASLRFPTASERGYYTLAVTSADADGWTATAHGRSDAAAEQRHALQDIPAHQHRQPGRPGTRATRRTTSECWNR